MTKTKSVPAVRRTGIAHGGLGAGKVELNFEVPLDPEGFLSRECPSEECEREFKVHAESAPVQGRYFCPICGRGASADEWWTRDQLRAAEDFALGQVTEALRKQMKGVQRRFLRGAAAMTYSKRPVALPQLLEADDMTEAIPCQCHSEVRLKLQDDWKGPPHCFACGTQ